MNTLRLHRPDSDGGRDIAIITSHVYPDRFSNAVGDEECMLRRGESATIEVSDGRTLIRGNTPSRGTRIEDTDITVEQV